MNSPCKKHILKALALLTCTSMAVPGVFAASERRNSQAHRSNETIRNGRSRNFNRFNDMPLEELQERIPTLWSLYLTQVFRLRRALDNNYRLTMSHSDNEISQDVNLIRMLRNARFTPNHSGLVSCEASGSAIVDLLCEAPVCYAVGRLIFDNTFLAFFDRFRTPSDDDTQQQELARDTNLIRGFAASWRRGRISYNYAHANGVYFGQHNGIGDITGYVYFEGNEPPNLENDGYYRDTMGISREEYLRRYERYWRNLANTLDNCTNIARRLCSRRIVNHPSLGELFM